ncbi:MAG: hypoxanthine phosphoribosyltransferase [Salibacteraceae bacterium]
MINLHGKSFVPYISRQAIADEVQRVGRELMVSFSNRSPLFLGVLNGSFMFFSDLMKEFSAPCEIGFVKAASYSGMQSTGKVAFHAAGELELNNRDVVIVEDIVDTGNTLAALHDFLEAGKPRSISVCTLLFKREAYRKNIPIDYVCFEVDNKFLLGYGLDFDGYGRNIPEVYILNE